MNRTLLKISDDMVALDELLAEGGGEIEATIERWMNELDADLQNKADGYAGLITEMRRRAEARQGEVERLRRLVEIDERNADFLRDRLKGVMERHGFKKIETERYRLTVANNGGKLPLLLDEADVPDGYKKQPPPIPDKDKIRADLDAGVSLPFARYGPRGTNLRIL